MAAIKRVIKGEVPGNGELAMGTEVFVENGTGYDLYIGDSSNSPVLVSENQFLQSGDFLEDSDIVDNLTSTDTDKPLSANQGKVLNDSKADSIHTHSQLHDQNSDTKLDDGQANEVTAAELRSHLDSTNDPHDTRNVSVTSKSSGWTFSSSDSDVIEFTGSSNVDATVPTNIPFPMAVRQAGTGVVTIKEGSGVTLTRGDVQTNGQYSWLVIIPVSSNTYDIIGGVA